LPETINVKTESIERAAVL